MKEASTAAELDRVARPILADLGLPWFAAASFFDSDRTPNTRVLFGTFHPEWAARYTQSNYSRQSRISGELLRTRHPYSWSGVIERRGIDPAQRRIWDEARDFGLTDGLFVPVALGDGTYSAVVLGGTRPPLDDPMLRTMAEVVASSYALHGRRLCGAGSAESFLTPRQRECLAWVAKGKSSSEIGMIIGTSSATVNEHVAEACRRLGVRTRLQAAIEAVTRGILTP